MAAGGYRPCLMLARAVRVADIRGIEVRLDPSVVLLAVLVTVLFATRFLDGFAPAVAFTMAGIGALLVVATTFAHELAHALEARHRGLEVESITLLLFGGVTEMHASGQSARDELAIAAVGPYVSLVCGAAFGLVATFTPDLLPSAIGQPVAEVAGLLGWWNVLLAVFNIVPGAPLDGGRVLRALLWMLLGDRLRALRISVRAGQVLGFGLVAAGVWVVATGALPLIPGLIGAFVLATTGVFIANAAQRELRHAELDEVLTGRTIRDLVAAFPTPWPAERPLTDGHARLVGDDDLDGELVTIEHADGRIGAVEVAAIDADAHDPDAPRTVGELGTDVTELPSIDVDADLHELVDTFQGDHRIVRVTREGLTIGALTEREVARALERLRRDRSRAARPADDEVARGEVPM